MKLKNIKLLLKTKDLKKRKIKSFMLPVPIFISTNTLRIYFSGVDKKNFGLPYFADFKIKNSNLKLTKLNENTVLRDKLNFFYKTGCCFISMTKYKKLFYATFAGFERPKNNRYIISTGLASTTNLSKKFIVKFNSPFLNAKKNLFTAGPFLLLAKKNILFSVEGKKFDKITGKPIYKIYSRVFKNFLNPIKNVSRKKCLDLKKNETAHARPFVIKFKNIYRMFFSVRGKNGKYTNYFGLAESTNCINWIRKKNIYVNKFNSACYLSVFYYQNKTYGLFNGKNFGEKGIYICKIN